MPCGCPPPVYAPVTPLAALGTAELLLVAALRLFAEPWRRPAAQDPVRGPDWRGGFRAAGIGDAAVPAFAALFGIVAAAPRRPLEVRRLHCRHLGRDEARLLQLVGLLQHGRDADAILADWLAPAAVRLALPRAQALAGAMAQGGLVVPWRHAEAAALGRIARGFADRGLALVQ